MARRCTTHHMCDCTAEKMREMEAKLDEIDKARSDDAKAFEKRLEDAYARNRAVTEERDALSSRLESCRTAWADSGAFSNHECYFGARLGACPESNECWECRLHLALWPKEEPVVETPMPFEAVLSCAKDGCGTQLRITSDKPFELGDAPWMCPACNPVWPRV